MNTKSNKGISKNRQSLLCLSKTIGNLTVKLLRTKAITKGTVYQQKKRCGNKNCKCARGELHHAKVLSFSLEGKTRLIPLTKFSGTEIYKIEKQVQYYQRFRRYRAKIVHNFKLFLTEINKLERRLLIEVARKGGSNADKK